jgi:hypothetical protein
VCDNPVDTVSSRGNTLYEALRCEKTLITFSPEEGVGGYCEAGAASAWTRLIPSSIKTLIVMTQTDLPGICRLYDAVVKSHLAAGCTVVTAMPESGNVQLELPRDAGGTEIVKANALVVPRIRRSTAYFSYLLLGKEVSRDVIERAAWLRLEPTELAKANVNLTTEECASLRADRVVLEAECRSTAAMWEALLEHGLDPLSWRTPSSARAQIQIVRKILTILRDFSPSPLVRRQLLYAILENDTERGKLLPDDLPHRVREIVDGLTAEAAEKGTSSR